GPARHADPAGSAVPVLHVRATCRGSRLPRGDSGVSRRAGAHRPAMGEYAPVQVRAASPGLRHGRLGDAYHARDGRRFGDCAALQYPFVRCWRLRAAGGLSDGRPGQGPHSDDRLRSTQRRDARPQPDGLRQRGSRARLDDRVKQAAHGEPPATERLDRATDLPLDAHLHTDLSPDSNVLIDVYAAEAAERGVAEIAITDHVDFLPGYAAYRYSTFEERERSVRQAAARWAERGVAIRFGCELTYERAVEDDVRDHLERHR